MSAPDDLLHSLLTGLPRAEKTEVLTTIHSAYDDQLERKRHPRRRRRRNADGELVAPEDFVGPED